MRAERTNATAHTRNPRRQRPLFVKVLAHNHDTRQKQQPVTNTHNDPLCDQQLPIRLANTSHHHAQYGEESAAVDQSTQVSRIIERTRYDTDEEEEKTLHGADPCYLGVGVRLEAG